MVVLVNLRGFGLQERLEYVLIASGEPVTAWCEGFHESVLKRCVRESWVQCSIDRVSAQCALSPRSVRAPRKVAVAVKQSEAKLILSYMETSRLVWAA